MTARDVVQLERKLLLLNMEKILVKKLPLLLLLLQLTLTIVAVTGDG
jgi:hypothetical protein